MINKELSDLTDINWGEFKIEDIFNIERSKVHDKINLKETREGIPQISRTNLDNGLNCIVINENFKHNPKNTIVFGAENANFFFQPFNYITGDKMYVISNENLNEYNSLFIKLMLEYCIKHSGFGYGKGLTGNRLKRRSILLPITEGGLPDWDVMESYIKTKEKFFLMQCKSYLERKLLVMQNREENLFSEDDFLSKNIKWDEFVIEDIFQVLRGKRLIENDRKTGRIPYYSAAFGNNGVTDFISNPLFIEENKIVVTTFGDAFFAEGAFTASDEITILHNEEINKYNGLFICGMIQNNKEKFKFGYKCFSGRIKRQTILLPVDENNYPDWDFMESFMKKIEYEKINKYLVYIENKLV